MHPRQASFVFALCLVAGCSGAPSPGPSHDAPPPSEADVRSRLVGLIEDVTAATAYRYGLTDDLDNVMDGAKVIRIPEARTFAAVYHTWSEADAAFHVHLATSDDLMTWTWVHEFGRQASQPTIAAASDGGYVVAWEQEPDPIHLTIAYYPTWDALRTGTAAKRIDPPVTTPACGEGTPSIETASSDRVAVAFHHHEACEHDRQAGGTTDWSTWEATTRPRVDDVLTGAGLLGSHGDRDGITFEGRDFTLYEGQLAQDDWTTFRVVLVDDATSTLQRLPIRTHAGSTAFTNPTISQIEVGGKDALLVTLFVPSEGARGGEAGELIYYRTFDQVEPG